MKNHSSSDSDLADLTNGDGAEGEPSILDLRESGTHVDPHPKPKKKRKRNGPLIINGTFESVIDAAMRDDD